LYLASYIHRIAISSHRNARPRNRASHCSILQTIVSEANTAAQPAGKKIKK